ncbi:DUF3368 domain-containing protein [Persicitalea sp.]|uniref:DUF3368 domain-containing protein n=1 Tax=Persicitalea sp. TaxID=3100273 RepID=UPI003593490A
MVIVSDTSIITNLIQLDQLSLLEKLYGEVVIPKRVLIELAKIPEQAEIIENTQWLSIQSTSDQATYDQLKKQLDEGESEAIALALELKADLLLLDERRGRSVARQHGILISGLLGVIIEAKSKGYLNKVKPLLDKLNLDIGFWISPKLYQDVLQVVNEL